jgi:hypothetical protein
MRQCVDIENLLVDGTGLMKSATLKVTGIDLTVKSTILEVVGIDLAIRSVSLRVLDTSLVSFGFSCIKFETKRYFYLRNKKRCKNMTKRCYESGCIFFP